MLVDENVSSWLCTLVFCIWLQGHLSLMLIKYSIFIEPCFFGMLNRIIGLSSEFYAYLWGVLIVAVCVFTESLTAHIACT